MAAEQAGLVPAALIADLKALQQASGRDAPQETLALISHGRFGLSRDDFRQRIRKGLVTSTVERGEAEDIGTSRLGVRLGTRVWRAVLNNEGEVQIEA